MMVIPPGLPHTNLCTLISNLPHFILMNLLTDSFAYSLFTWIVWLVIAAGVSFVIYTLMLVYQDKTLSTSQKWTWAIIIVCMHIPGALLYILLGNGSSGRICKGKDWLSDTSPVYSRHASTFVLSCLPCRESFPDSSGTDRASRPASPMHAPKPDTQAIRLPAPRPSAITLWKSG